jgi:hypothetical protein
MTSPPVMIPLSELEVLVLGLTGQPQRLEASTRGSYEVECGCTSSICYRVRVLPAHTEAPFSQPEV